MRALKHIINETFDQASPHTKKIFGEPMKADEVVQVINTGKPFTSGFVATTKKNRKPPLSWDLVA